MQVLSPEIEKMCKDIKKHAFFRSSLTLCRAIAEDMSLMSNAECKVMESDTVSSRTGKRSLYIKSLAFEVNRRGKFFLLSDAEEYKRLLEISVDNIYINYGNVKSIVNDYGIVQSIDILIAHRSPFVCTLAVYKTVSISNKFGI